MRARAVVLAATLLVTGCARGDEETEAATTTTAGDVATEPTSRLDAGAFGDLTDVCTDGDGGGTDVGLSDDAVEIGVLTDKGYSAAPGLNREAYDAAVAFASWCNEHGGIGGRELVVNDRDAALLAYQEQVTNACEQDFALVGGGAVLDDDPNGVRVGCGLPSIPGFVVSTPARGADLQVQAVPNPTDAFNAGAYQALAAADPDAAAHFGVMSAAFGPVLDNRAIAVDALEQSGYGLVHVAEFSATGESNWRPFVEALESAGVQGFEMVGDPQNLAQLMEAMRLVDFFPRVTLLNTNYYDRGFVDLVGDFAPGVVVRSQFTPLELADENPATADYVELMERYNPGGKVAQLGMQAVSSLLLFARAAGACGTALDRACLLDQATAVSSWTGGGLHAEQDPSTATPSACFVLLRLVDGGFEVDEELTRPTDGIFNCEDDNLVEITALG
jgi:hypothetical protein